jgi:hypothetical protein
VQQPALSAAQAIQLFEEAGFALKDGRPVNRCGTPSNPRVAFIDLNGDRRAEAHVADVDPRCYGKPGAYFAILEQEADGRWKRLIAEDGIVGFQRERSIGWNNLSLEPANSACPGLRRFNGTDYGAPTACGTFANLAAAPASQAQAPAQAAPRINGPLSQEKLFDWSGEQLPEARDLPETERNALFRAADIQPIGGGKWSGCPDDPSGHSEAEVSMVRDLNGDDRPEALILDGGTFCYGHVGVGSTVLTKTATGSWKVLYTNQGFVNFLVSRGTDGFPDIEAGLPGFCFPYFRWNGQEYELIARLSDEGKACEPF